ncbi:MAG: exosome complex protein Rrp42 [archaeon]
MRNTVLEYEVTKTVELARLGKRTDGRGLEEMREFTVEINKYENAEGSARVLLGKTEVAAGVKIEVGKPYPDSPDEGAISIGAELLPLAHSEYEAGPPSMDEIEIARVVDRGLRESKSIDFSKLCIKEGEAILVAYMDFYAINSDGNMFDAGSIAGLVSLMNSKLPKVDEKNRIVKHEYTGKLQMTKQPLLSTFVKIGGKIMVDPTYLEEKAAEARFSVASTEDGKLCAMQKGMGGSFTVDEVNYMIETGIKVAKETRKKLAKFL